MRNLYWANHRYLQFLLSWFQLLPYQMLFHLNSFEVVQMIQIIYHEKDEYLTLKRSSSAPPFWDLSDQPV
jgi:hypothetical protein